MSLVHLLNNVCFIFYMHGEELFFWHIEERFIHTSGYWLCDLNFN